MKPPKIIHQAGALALCEGEICLVTNASGRSWTVPKGHVEPHMTSREAALVECFEEAGLTGVTAEDPLGTYSYVKNGQSHLVTVYLMHVSEVLARWPESHRRHRAFLAPALALRKITNPGLRALISKAKLISQTAGLQAKRPAARLRIASSR